MTHLYYFVAGFLCVLTFLLLKKKEKKPSVPIKSGLLLRSYTCSDAHQKGVSVDYEIEVVEIDSSESKSKIKLLVPAVHFVDDD